MEIVLDKETKHFLLTGDGKIVTHNDINFFEAEAAGGPETLMARDHRPVGQDLDRLALPVACDARDKLVEFVVGKIADKLALPRMLMKIGDAAAFDDAGMVVHVDDHSFCCC